MKKNIFYASCLILVAIMAILLIGRGQIDPSKVTEEYVKQEFTKHLESYYGTNFVVSITSLDENSNSRNAVAIAYPKVDPSVKCEITGTIKDDYFDATKIGSSYHVSDDFDSVLYEKFNQNYSFVIDNNTNYKSLSNEVTNYLKKQLVFFNNYKKGSVFEHLYSDKYLRGEVLITVNGQETNNDIIIDKKNNKVITDTSTDSFAWRGEISLEEYLKLVAANEVAYASCKIRCQNLKESGYKYECKCNKN